MNTEKEGTNAKAIIPMALIYSRLAIGFVICGLSLFHLKNFGTIAIVLISIGLLTDVFDGIIARRLNVSSTKLRRLDSGIDQVFWILTAVAAFIHAPDFFRQHAVQLVLLLAAEAMIYAVCFLKFKREVATHSIAAKIWTLFLFATLIQIIASSGSGILFQLFFYIGIVTRLEILAIIIILDKWTNDVPTFYHAVLLRQGKPIKRHKLFNG